MMLVEEGKLSLDDPVSKHLSGVSAAGKAVTVRHLLSHTSGITDYHDRAHVESDEIYDDTVQDCEKWVANFTMAAPPGERFAYIGTGYFLLGKIVEKISGKPFEQFLRERIFDPLEMKQTRLVNFNELIPNRAAGYAWKGGGFQNSVLRVDPVVEFAKGGAISNVLDMAKWDAALYTEKLLKRATLQEMWINARLSNGEVVTSYGLGFGLTPFRGHRRVGHTGSGPGFVSAYTRFIDDKLTVIVLANANHEGITIGEMANEIASFYFPANLDSP
jgi:D-alanyl-D-alanine carboxypeptidase